MEQRTFIPGIEWLYYKIYTGEVTADRLLSEIISKIVHTLISEKRIDKWFFIRYHDPDFHLRIRFHFDKPEHIPIIINRINQELADYIDEKIIWKIQLDTYQRELERYDLRKYENVENIFFIDSEFVIKTIQLIEEYENENLLWLTALKSIDDWLEINGVTGNTEKWTTIKPFADYFAGEFNMNKKSRKQINDKFKKYYDLIDHYLNGTAQTNFSGIFSLLQERKKHIKEILQGEKLSETALSGFIHMSINRIFQTENRKYEWILYQFLFLYYRRKSADKKYQKDKPTTKPE